MKVEKSDHPWLSPHYLIRNGQIRRKGIERPHRERVLVRAALHRLKMRYKELVPFKNMDYKGRNGKHHGSIQWVDFLVYSKGKMCALIFYPNRGTGGLHKYKKESLAAKTKLLTDKGIPYLILKRNLSSMEYEILIRRLVGGKYYG